MFEAGENNINTDDKPSTKVLEKNFEHMLLFTATSIDYYIK